MFAAVIFAVAIVALMQFAVYYWRAVLSAVASQPVSSQLLEAAHLEDASLSGADFPKLASLLALTPELRRGGNSLGFVGLYHSIVRRLSSSLGQISPAFLDWTQRESTLCARYVAVQIDRRLQANLVQAAAIRSC